MDSKKKKKIIFLSVAIVLVVVVAISVLLYSLYGSKKKKDDSNTAGNVSNSQTNTSIFDYTNVANDSILEKVLSTANYQGKYKLSTIQSVEFNMWSEDNSTGLTNENIRELYNNKGVKDSNGFKQYLLNRRAEKADIFNINSITSSTGGTEDYGVLDATSTNGSYQVSTGKVYGDENLAVVVFDNPKYYDKNFFMSNEETNNHYIFISLTFDAKQNASNVSDGNKNTPKTIYVFENVYDKNIKDLRLFTVAYAYTLVPPINISPDF